MSGSVRLPTLLKGSFDNTTAAKLADVGRLEVTSGADRFGLEDDVFDPNSGQVAVFDDTGTQGELDVTVEGTFTDSMMSIKTGPIALTWELVAEQMDATFSVGVGMDNPSSDIYPVGGADGSGGLTLGGMPSGVDLVQNTPIQFTIVLDRDSVAKNWTWTGSIKFVANGFSAGGGPVGQQFMVLVNVGGTLLGTAGKSVNRVVFSKVSGTTGVFSLDDVTVAGKP